MAVCCGNWRKHIVAVCCGNWRKHTSADFVAIRSLTIISPVVLYGCGLWSLTVMEERRLRMLENRILRGIFGPQRDE